ncbi:OmpP1/FadL family transporter [Oligoflexia bacterium]|nr:OmpP1/FadL family transporter [Oligoflexia bacterium]
MKNKSYFFASFCLAFVLCTGDASAGGYAILEQSAEGVGNAFAGATAGYGDGSEVSFNPAAMAWLDGTLISHNSHLIVPSSKFHNTGSTHVATGAPLAGDNGPDGGEAAYVPNFYVVHQMSDKINVGLGVNAPFGLSTNYSDDWVGRYHGIKTDLTTININPALSLKLHERFAVGGGLNVIYSDAELSNAIDFGTIGVATLGLPTASALGLLPQMADGKGRLEGDDWALGYNLGAGYAYGEGSKVGLSWHSKVDISHSGRAYFDVPTAAMPLTSTGLFTDTTGTADITLPDYANLGWVHRINKEWAVLGEIQWTHWSRFEELRIVFGSNQPDSVVDESWRNTWRYSAGLNFNPCEALTLRGGFTYDQTPIDSSHRTPRIPGNSRKWLALGADYQITDALSAGLNYAHLFVSDAKSNILSSTGHNLVGDWDLTVDIVSLNLAWAF